jgi:phosphoglycolate phosphatase-like HAD superfamily hydrolase
VKAIVFDWDLTLWNSWDTHIELLRQTAGALGAARPQAADVAARYSIPFLQHLESFFPGDQQRVMDTYMAFYRRIVRHMPDLYPGVAETLSHLKETGYRLAVFSDKRHAFGVAELAQTGIGGLIDYSLFLLDGRPYKPNPQGL